jgi:hypothetical protein
MPRAAPVTTATFDERRARRQEEPQRAHDARGRHRHAVGDDHAVARRTAPQLLGERAQQPVDALPRGRDRGGVVGARGA